MDRVLRSAILNSNVIDVIQDNKRPFDELMSKYRCASMEAKCLLDQDDIELLETKDYIKNPKPSGYRSLHLIVRVPIFLQNEKCFMKVEVQLRTIAMDFWASLEHKLRYKKEIPEFEKDSLQKELFECAQMINTLDQRMEAVKNRLAAGGKWEKS